MSEGLHFSLRFTPHSGWVFTSTKALCDRPPTGSNRLWLSFLGLAWVIYSPSHCPLLLLEECGHIHCPSWGHHRAPGLQLPPHWALASCLRGMQRQARGGLEEAWGQGSGLSTSWPSLGKSPRPLCTMHMVLCDSTLVLRREPANVMEWNLFLSLNFQWSSQPGARSLPQIKVR